MSDDVIRKGDLCVVVRGDQCYLGMFFQVEKVRHPFMGWHCPECGASKITDELVAQKHDGHIFPLSWLKKIQPPSIDESTETHQEITA